MQFAIRERIIQCTDERLIGDNADYSASFTFDSEWNGKVKTARFQHVNKGIYCDVILQDDACTIPAVILKAGFVRIGVFTDAMTSTHCEIKVVESIKEKNGSPAAPSYDVYAQIISMIENNAGGSGTNGRDGVDGKDGKDGVDGITYTPAIGTVATLDAGSDATASVEISGTTATFSFGIPKGADGASGIISIDSLTDDEIKALWTKLVEIAGAGGSGSGEEEPNTPVEVVLTGISASKTTTTYTEGDALDTSDIITTATYSDGSTTTVSGTVDSSAVNMSVAGSYNITVTYEGKAATIAITVESAAVIVDDPVVPQSGTWQIQDTSPNAYAWFSLDDDLVGISSHYDELKQVPDIPLVWNMESESINKMDSGNINMTTKARELKAELGDRFEVTQHGGSGKCLTDSSAYSNDFWNTCFNNYVSNGGTLAQAQFKEAMLNVIKSYDIAQGASYVLDARDMLESALGFPVRCIAAWGSSGTLTVDGIDVISRGSIPSAYGSKKCISFFRENNYKIASWLTMLASNPPYVITRISTATYDAIKNRIDELVESCSVYDFFQHGLNGQYLSIADLKKAYEYGYSVGLNWVTPSQYYAKGEFVDDAHLVISLDCTIPALYVGDTWTNPSIVATFADGHSAVVNGSIVGNVDTTQAGNNTIKLFYHGIWATKTVTVNPAGASYPDNSIQHHAVIVSNSDANKKLYIGNTTQITNVAASGGYWVVSSASGKVSVWQTDDGGQSWVQKVNNVSRYATFTIGRSTKTGGNGYYEEGVTDYFLTGNSMATIID